MFLVNAIREIVSFKMTDNPEISIIIPYGYYTADLATTLRSTISQNCRFEIILVTNCDLRRSLDLEGMLSDQYRIVESNEVGRGYFCSAGVLEAKGSILLFLHADTILPDQWCQRILDKMANPEIAGGGFSVYFRTSHWFVKRISKLYNLFSQLIRELWGDRAIFMRKRDLLSKLDQIKVPLMEDVEMSKIIRKNGKMILLPDAVSTSALHFTVKGHFRHIIEVIFFRILYALGVSADRIYKWYYR